MTLLRQRILGQDIHPLYRDVLQRAIGQSYALPSPACQRLQNTMVKALYDAGIWTYFDYLYMFANDGGSLDMGRINWRQPTKPLSASVGTYIHKQGMTGTVTHAFNIVTDKINFNISNPYASQFAWLTEAGASILATEHLVALNIENAGNGRIHRISLRTNPRVDYCLNTTSAGPAVLYAAYPVDNQFYMTDIGNIAASITMTNFINGVQTYILGGTATGVLPDGGSTYTQLVSPKSMALFGGGYSFNTISTTYPALLYQIFQNYMTQLQLLP